MTFAAPVALLFGLSALVVAFLALLRPRLERHRVAALFLWEGLKQDTRSKRIHFRQLLDPVLLLQVLSLLLLVAALSLPLLSTARQRLSALAILIDGSASMHTVADGDRTRYEIAVDEAKEILTRTSASRTSIIQVSTLSVALGQALSGRSDAFRALENSSATWAGDASSEDIQNTLAAAGGAASFDRIVLISDGPAPGLPESVEWIPVAGGENVAITRFSVRENPSGEGMTAFAEIRNETGSPQTVDLAISDGAAQASLSLLVEAGSAEQAIIPFPTSRGSVFTIFLEAVDDFPSDNQRFFALDRPLDLRVRWIGPPNRFLSAALAAVTPFSIVSAAEEADLTVVHQTTIPTSYAGAILLLNSQIEGVLVLGDEQERTSVHALSTTSSLIQGLVPADLRVFSSPDVSLPDGATVLLQADDAPLLVTWRTETQDVTAFTARLETTNLPLSVDLPLLVRNVVADVSRLPAGLGFAWTHVGDAVALFGRGAVRRLTGPNGTAIPLASEETYYFPDVPGVYEFTTSRGVFPLAVNVPPSESAPRATAEVSGTDASATPERTAQLRRHWADVWPLLAAVVVSLLIAEAFLRKRAAAIERGWRT